MEILEVAKEHVADDAYSYRKYGAKGPTQTRNSTRHYFKCNQEGCNARKIVEISHDNADTKMEMMGTHNHAPDATVKVQKRKPRDAMLDSEGQYGAVTVLKKPAAPLAAPEQTKSKRAAAQNVSNVIQLVKSGHSSFMDEDPPTPPARPRAVPRPRSLTGLNLKSPGLQRSASAAGELSDCKAEPDASPAGGASRWAAGSVPEVSTSAPGGVAEAADDEAGTNFPGHEGVHMWDTRLAVSEWREMEGSLALLFAGTEKEYIDDYAWRKYGKKEIKGCLTSCPRFYWRCTDKSCDIKRHTQATADGRTEVHYYGRHNHYPPPQKVQGGSKRGRVQDSGPQPSPYGGRGDGAFIGERHESGAGAYDDDEDWAGGEGEPSWRAGRSRGRRPDHGSAAISPQASFQSQESGHLADSSSMPHRTRPRGSSHVGDFEDAVGRLGPAALHRDLPDSPRRGARCPLFFLACVAAKEPWI